MTTYKKRSNGSQKGKVGRKAVPQARGEFLRQVAQRITDARIALGKRRGREITKVEMAKLLSDAVGYTVPADNYRKYEDVKAPTAMPIDLLFPFAEITGTTVGMLLSHPFLAPARAA